MASPCWCGRGRPTRGEAEAAVDPVVIVASGVERVADEPPVRHYDGRFKRVSRHVRRVSNGWAWHPPAEPGQRPCGGRVVSCPSRGSSTWSVSRSMVLPAGWGLPPPGGGAYGPIWAV